MHGSRTKLTIRFKCREERHFSTHKSHLHLFAGPVSDTIGVMSEVLYTNIFFVITGIAVIVFSVILCVAVLHAIKALRTLRRILDKIEAGTEVITEDVRSVRAFFAQEGLIRRVVTSIVSSARGGKKRASKVGRSERRKENLEINEET